MSATGRTGARIFICTRFRVLLLVGFFRRGFNDDGIGDDRRPEKLAVISRERFMFRLGTHVLLAGILACLGAGAVLAQNQTQPQSTKPPATSTIKMEDASKWTQKRWDAAKAKWSEEKARWQDCQKQAKQAKLSGRKSWQFLYDCMTR